MRQLTQPQVSAAGKFSRYKPEIQNPDRVPQVKGDEIFTQLDSAWRIFSTVYENNVFDLESTMIHQASVRSLTAEKYVYGIPYSASDIGKFSILLAGYSEFNHFADKAGVFLSALANMSKVDVITLPLSHFIEPPHCLGTLNTKNLTIIGDVGNVLGVRNSGNITVEGNAGKYAGHSMLGGKISIYGNCGGRAGLNMEDGLIEIYGKAGENVGTMQNGTILLHGKYVSLAPHVGGRIYHRGKLIAGVEHE